MKKITLCLSLYFFLLTSLAIALEPILVLCGPPGSGKGTFSQYLKENYGFAHVSSGDLVRAEIDRQTDLGKAIEEIVRRGDFIDQDIMHRLMRERILEFVQENRSFIIDGFIRLEKSLIFLSDIFHELGLSDRVVLVDLAAADDICTNRILSRIVCPTCSHVYNLNNAKPVQEGTCDICLSSLKIRLNDEPAVIMKRLDFYRNEIQPLVDSAKQLFPYVNFDTQTSLPECFLKYDNFINNLLQFSGNSEDLQTLLNNIAQKYD
jgi:adenylate kinase